MSIQDVVNGNLAGIQVAVFELIWPSLRWIDSIYLLSSPGACTVFVQSTDLPSSAERKISDRLLKEIFDEVRGDTVLSLQIKYEKSVPTASVCKEVMSQEIFKLIAMEVAPWRLDAGR